MKQLVFLVLWLVLGYQSAFSLTATGGSALALASLVAEHSPALSSGERSVRAHLFDDLDFTCPGNKEISVEISSVVCRTSNNQGVDVDDLNRPMI